MRGHYLILAVAMLWPSAASAACFDSSPVSRMSDRSRWSDLENRSVPATLNPLIKAVQTVQTGSGDINTDYYSITIDSVPGETLEALLRDVRDHLDELISSGTRNKVMPHDEQSAALWKSSSPVGALMSFRLMRGFKQDLKRASVVVSCASPTDWVFSTVETEEDGQHPVAGNRGFAVRRNADASISIITKGADRTQAGFPWTGAPCLTFREGSYIWLRLLNNLGKRYASRNPRSRYAVPLVRPYNQGMIWPAGQSRCP